MVYAVDFDLERTFGVENYVLLFPKLSSGTLIGYYLCTIQIGREMSMRKLEN